MIGMHMSLDDPLQIEPALLDLGDHLVGMLVGDATCGVVDVHHRVDDGAGVGVRVLHDVADRVGRLVEERCDLWFDVHAHRVLGHRIGHDACLL